MRIVCRDCGEERVYLQPMVHLPDRGTIGCVYCGQTGTYLWRENRLDISPIKWICTDSTVSTGPTTTTSNVENRTVEEGGLVDFDRLIANEGTEDGLSADS